MVLTACLVIHNEEKHLPRSLASIKDIVDEIIIVHDGECTDRSLIIARQFKAKIFIRPFIGEAEHHRPFSFEKARGEWILQIDADEFLSEKAKKAIPQLIKQQDTDAYSFLWPYPIDNTYIKRGPFAKTFKPCLFRKKKMFMIGISHEYLHTYGRLEKRPDILLEHKPSYDNYTSVAFQIKWIKWAKLQALQIYHLNQAPIFNIHDVSASSIYNYYLSMRKLPLISGIKDSFRFLLIYLTRGIFWAGLASWKIAYFELRYIWLVKLYLNRLKHGQRI